MPDRRPISLALLVLLLLWGLAACGPAGREGSSAEKSAAMPAQDGRSAETDAVHAQEFAAFRQERHDNLKQPGSWLTLVGLYWLHPGENSAGSAPTAEIVFPLSLPASLGTFVVPGPNGAAAELRTVGGFGVKVDGEEGEKTVVPMFADVSGKATVVRVGSVSFFVIDRQGKIGVRIKDSESATLKSFAGIETYPLSWEWRLRTRFVPAPPGKKIKVPNVLGQVDEQESAGTIEFEKDGRTWRIEALLGEGEDGLYFVFGDGSNGRGSYGGGRFLEAKVEGGSRKTATTALVDFNLAYNPPCVFTPFATCPLPPAESKIELPIEAGEKVWGTH